MDAKQREATLLHLADLEAKDEAEMLTRAVGWVVLSVDDEFGYNYIVGVFDEPAAALEYEQKMSTDLKSLTSATMKGWTTSVLPIMPPT